MHCCSQCSFTAQFESALTMHKQLHHEVGGNPELNRAKVIASKANTVPRASIEQPFPGRPSKSVNSPAHKLPGRTPSASRLFDKLRTRICRSKAMLFSHPEEKEQIHIQDLTSTSECSTRDLKMDLLNTSIQDQEQHTYSCHLCVFDADRITILDRHLLNDHKIGLDNLLKLVLAKTKHGLSDENSNKNLYGIRQPYYTPPDQILEGEFIVETVQPKIKILKHASTNTEIMYPDFNDNCKMIKEELDKFMKQPIDRSDKGDLMAKMQTLNDYMCRFVNSSNALKRVLELESKSSVMKRTDNLFELGIGESDTPKSSSGSFYF